ncbi:MAG: hypothetical protein NZ821_07950 [Gloeomargarita sp. SKYB31]|nr:hypothetical protein [Gloeomargarita sp. SKYB31]
MVWLLGLVSGLMLVFVSALTLALMLVWALVLGLMWVWELV